MEHYLTRLIITDTGPSIAHFFFCGRAPVWSALFSVKKPVDNDSILFKDHHQIRELHRKAKHDLRMKKRSEYAREQLRKGA